MNWFYTLKAKLRRCPSSPRLRMSMPFLTWCRRARKSWRKRTGIPTGLCGKGLCRRRFSWTESAFPKCQTRHSLSIGGLGLHVAWTIAQKMGGSLTASSELGTGSCFLFAVSVTASVPELPNERYCVTDSGADCEWMQDADFPDVPDFCQRILELIDMGAVSEIDELLDYLYAKEMISPTLFLALKQDNAQLHFDRIAQICGGSRRRISSD